MEHQLSAICTLYSVLCTSASRNIYACACAYRRYFFCICYKILRAPLDRITVLYGAGRYLLPSFRLLSNSTRQATRTLAVLRVFNIASQPPTIITIIPHYHYHHPLELQIPLVFFLPTFDRSIVLAVSDPPSLITFISSPPRTPLTTISAPATLFPTGPCR